MTATRLRDAEQLADEIGQARRGQDVGDDVEAGGEQGDREQPQPEPADSWPAPMAEDAFYGLAGDIVRIIAPTTEADPVALLVQILAYFGNCAGREPHFLVEDTRHGLNEYVAIVGATGKGRKGTSEKRVRRLFERADQVWIEERVNTGLSSGEGLIYHVRDEVRDSKGNVEDEGVSDKRLLVVESELGTVLKRIQGEANSLSAVMRDAWDSSVLNTMTKNSKNRAATNHISVVGHITTAELTRHLTGTEMANGFGNRFIYACVRRSRELPLGAEPPNLNEPLAMLHDALEFARQCRSPIVLDAEATRAWCTVYGALSDGKPGLYGAIIGRAEAHVRRLAAIYAVLDLCSEVQLPHLLAALGLWDYAEASARHIFGQALGDPRADEVMNALLSKAMTKEELRNHFNRHWTSDHDRALDRLMATAMVRAEVEKGRGRPATRYYPTRSRGGSATSYLQVAKESGCAVSVGSVESPYPAGVGPS